MTIAYTKNNLFDGDGDYGINPADSIFSEGFKDKFISTLLGKLVGVRENIDREVSLLRNVYDLSTCLDNDSYGEIMDILLCRNKQIDIGIDDSGEFLALEPHVEGDSHVIFSARSIGLNCDMVHLAFRHCKGDEWYLENLLLVNGEMTEENLDVAQRLIPMCTHISQTGNQIYTASINYGEKVNFIMDYKNISADEGTSLLMGSINLTQHLQNSKKA